MTETSLAKILVVDDEQASLNAIYRILRREFEVILSLTSQAALEVLKHQEISCARILADQRMLQGFRELELAIRNVWRFTLARKLPRLYVTAELEAALCHAPHQSTVIMWAHALTLTQPQHNPGNMVRFS